MKNIGYFFMLLLCVFLGGACSNDVEFKDIDKVQRPLTYDDLYYKNLREFKKTKHSISFMWFAQYDANPAIHFSQLPDSLDICSLWQGIPTDDSTKLEGLYMPEKAHEMQFCQKVKGTKMVWPKIVRLWAEDDGQDFKKVLNEGEKLKREGKTEEGEALVLKAIDMYADHFADVIFDNNLDGFDADYEPEGDKLTGAYFVRFIKRLALYMGPNPDQTKEERLKFIQERYGKEATDTCKLLCIDATGEPEIETEPYTDYMFLQNYGGSTPSMPRNWPVEKMVYCVNWGDNWNTDGTQLYNQARWQPSKGMKGGFGAFYGNRDYMIHQYNPVPYSRFRECIQIQNPAVY